MSNDAAQPSINDAAPELDESPRLPWWTWLTAVAVVATCYQINEHGNGLMSITVAAVICRFALAPYCARTAGGRLGAGILLALGGFLGYLVALGLLAQFGVIEDRSEPDRESRSVAPIHARR